MQWITLLWCLMNQPQPPAPPPPGPGVPVKVAAGWPSHGRLLLKI